MVEGRWHYIVLSTLESAGASPRRPRPPAGARRARAGAARGARERCRRVVAFLSLTKANGSLSRRSCAHVTRGALSTLQGSDPHLTEQSQHAVGGTACWDCLVRSGRAIRVVERAPRLALRPHGAATACCLSDDVRAPAHVACGFAQGSSGKDSRAPGRPLSHDTKQLSMDLCVSSLALAASLTSQYWSNWSPGRLPDLSW